MKQSPPCRERSFQLLIHYVTACADYAVEVIFKLPDHARYTAKLRIVKKTGRITASYLFKCWRDCPSGQLSKKKFIEVYSGFFPDGNAEEFCTHVFRTFDKDNSGKIDFKEFLLAINITSGGRPKEKLEWAYQMYDIDGNGTIERNEMVEIIRVVQQVSSESDFLILRYVFI
ncbi:unnamed protein product [Schistocephalus solidus]|uniref:Neuronal calcium sensor 2 n=1 Tax=Schistocephalus solidus TaxID=70667 RepID=A0A183T574_SCHSO|nr:unnamed protein product [Schistocephalus solidus]